MRNREIKGTESGQKGGGLDERIFNRCRGLRGTSKKDCQEVEKGINQEQKKRDCKFRGG